MALAAYFVFNQAVKGGGYIVVPDVVGLPLNKASNVLAEAGLETGKQRQVVSDRFPEYHVLLQRPAASKVVRSGRKIQLTISAGTQYEQAPYLVGRNLEAAKQNLEGTRMILGSIARIPNESIRGLVLGQDPAAGQDVPVGGEIHLLVSDGPLVQPVFMPDLVGKTIDEALSLLAEFDVPAIPYHVNTPGVEYDVVLAQSPKSGTLLHEEDPISFDVRLLETTKLPNVRRKVALEYTVPATSMNPQVRVDILDQNGDRTTVYPRPADYRNGVPPRLRPRSKITIPFSYLDVATVEFYVDGVPQSSYYYEGNADPVVQIFNTPDSGDDTSPSGTDDGEKPRRRFPFLPRR